MIQALKEWAVVCRALEEGRQAVLLRKGGILEYRQGFEVKHEKFLMFPTFEHQSKAHLQADYADRLEQVMMDQPPAGTVTMSAYAEANEVREVNDMDVIKRLQKFHVWNESYVKARMDYNPTKPMSVILVRVFKLDNPIQIRTQPEWAGCKSWVPVDVDDPLSASPIQSDPEFGNVAREFREVLSIAA